MVNRCPYIFAERSRAGMIRAIVRIAAPYAERYQPAFLFSWNVKLHHGLPMTAAELAPHYDESGAFDPALDSAWEAECEGNSSRFEWLIEDMRRPYVDGEYCTYPGDDQGQFQFGFYGRQGGHLCLESAFGRDLRGDIDDLAAELASREEWPFADLRRLYRALVCMDSDFGPDKVRKEAAYQWGFQRAQWEAEKRDERAAANAVYAAELEASRPDLYARA